MRRAVTAALLLSFPQSFSTTTARLDARADVDTLIRDIDRLCAQQGRGARRLQVPASQLPRSAEQPAERQEPPETEETEETVARAMRERLVFAPSLPAAPGAGGGTGIACTLQELERTLLRLSAAEETAQREGGNEEALPRAEEALHRSYWTGELCEESGTVAAPLRIARVDAHTYIVEQRDVPRRADEMVSALSDALSALERIPSVTRVVFTTAEVQPFFAPRDSEETLSHTARVALLLAKDRLFRRMHSSAQRGVCFVAAPRGPVSDMGAELCLACEERGGDEGPMAFPGIACGAWPAPRSVARMIAAIGAPGATALYAQPWSDARGAAALEREAEGAADPLRRHWRAYCELVRAAESRGEPDATGTAESAAALYARVLRTRAARAAARSATLRRERLRRVLRADVSAGAVVLPAGAGAGAWASAVAAAPPGALCVFADGAAPEARAFVAAQRASRGLSCAALGGAAEAVAGAAALLDCAVALSPLDPAAPAGLAPGQWVEARVLKGAAGPAAEALAGAVAFLRSRGAAALVTGGADGVGVRLAAALAAALCALARDADARLVEATAVAALALRVPPFALLDAYGAPALSRALRRNPRIGAGRSAPSAAAQALRAATGEGRSDSTRGQMATGQVTRGEVALRLLAPMANACCDMLLEDAATAEDLDCASVPALAMRPSSGGVLTCVERAMGLPALVANMEFIAQETGAVEPPSPLLLEMRDAGESFYTLSEETMARARKRSSA